MEAISRSRVVNLYLLGALLLAIIATTLFITHSSETSGIFIACGIIALGVGIFSIVFPVFGYYITIFISFFIFDVIRVFNTDLPVVSVVDILVYITFFGFILQKTIKRESFFLHCKNPIMIGVALLILYRIIEYFNPNGGSTELYFLLFRRFLSLILFLYCSIQVFTDFKAVVNFLKVILILCFIAALYGCYEKWFGMPKFELNYILEDEMRYALNYMDNGEFRMSSIFSGCTDFGLFMAGTAIISLILFLQHWGQSKIQQIFLLISVVIMSLAMAYSGTRTATFMLIVEVILYILMTINQKRTLLFTGVFAFLCCVIMLVPSYGNGTLIRLRSAFDLSKEESLKVRDVNRHNIQPYIYQHPIGGGIGTTGAVYAQYNVGHPLAGFPTDSGILNIVLEFGWLGLIVHFLGYFLVLQQGVQAYFRSRKKEFKVLLLASTVCYFGYVFAQYSQTAIGQIPSSFLVYGIIAVIIRLPQIEKKIS